MTTETQPPEIVHRHRGLVGRTVFVAALTLLSRLFGFVREVLMASVFGDKSAISDAFFTAWQVPNLFRRLFGEGALSTSLQAALTEADGAGGNEAGRRLFLRTLRVAVVLLLFVAAAAMLVAHALPDQMPLTGWAWLGKDPAPVRDLAVRVLPYVVLVCLAALAGGALQVRGHYAASSFGPTVMNVTWIVALVALGVAFGWSASGDGAPDVVLERQWRMARILAWGVLGGGVLQLLLHVPPLVTRGLLRAGDGGDRRGGEFVGKTPGQVLWSAMPLALGAAVYQINVMIDGSMAEGMLRDGGPTALYYANRIQQFPLALVATATTASVFPLLKAHGHLRDLGKVRALHDDAQSGVLFLALPAAAGLIALAHPISSVLFEHGNYGALGVERVASGLRMLALALVPAGAVGLLGRTYIALDDLRTPVRISISMLVFNVVLNVVFVRGLDMDVAGFALSTAISSWGNLALLVAGMRRQLGLPAGRPDRAAQLARLVAVGVATGVVAWGVWRAGAWAFEPSRSWSRAVLLVAAIAGGTGAFLLAGRALGIEELDSLRQRLARRAGRR